MTCGECRQIQTWGSTGPMSADADMTCGECGQHVTGGVLRDSPRYRLQPCGHVAEVKVHDRTFTDPQGI